MCAVFRVDHRQHIHEHFAHTCGAAGQSGHPSAFINLLSGISHTNPVLYTKCADAKSLAGGWSMGRGTADNQTARNHSLHGAVGDAWKLVHRWFCGVRNIQCAKDSAHKRCQLCVVLRRPVPKQHTRVNRPRALLNTTAVWR